MGWEGEGREGYGGNALSRSTDGYGDQNKNNRQRITQSMMSD